jgi:hypothetical protein
MEGGQQRLVSCPYLETPILTSEQELDKGQTSSRIVKYPSLLEFMGYA